MGWKHGQEFEIAAMQAVVAAMLDGKTLHQTCSVSFGKDNNKGKKKYKKALRWLIIDEISQVSSSLLAKCEEHTKDSIDMHGTYKLDPLTDLIRDWGGVNVVFVGDFNQLPPADGVALDTIPNILLPESLTATQTATYKGLSLIWEGVNKLIELKIQQRAADEWWMEVVNEVRFGNMSRVNHCFLHGLPTAQPGSWSHVQQKCVGCKEGCTVMETECTHCASERRRRCRVFNSGTSPPH